MEHRFTKCECCPYYACIQEENSDTRKWDCTRLRGKEKCVYNSLTYDSKMQLIELWINANIKAEEDKLE